jgi:hypothetical protein
MLKEGYLTEEQIEKMQEHIARVNADEYNLQLAIVKVNSDTSFLPRVLQHRGTRTFTMMPTLEFNALIGATEGWLRTFPWHKSESKSFYWASIVGMYVFFAVGTKC